MCLFAEEQHNNAQMQRWLAKLVSSCQVANRVASELGCEVGGPTVSVLRPYYQARLQGQTGWVLSSMLSVVLSFCACRIHSWSDASRLGGFSCAIFQLHIVRDQNQVTWGKIDFKLMPFHIFSPFHFSSCVSVSLYLIMNRADHCSA